MNTHRSAVDRWIFEEYRLSDRSLAISRIIIAFCLFGSSPRYLWVGAVPESFYAPPLGLAMFLSHQPPSWVMWGITAAMKILTVAFLVGWRTRHVGVALALLILVGNSFAYAFGKIDHDILLVTTIVVLSFAGTNRHYAFDASHRSAAGEPPRWPLALHALIVSLAMLSAALPKIASGWLDPSTQSTKGHMVFNLHASERHTILGQFMTDHGPDWLWECLDWSTIGLECALLPAMFSLKAIRVVCALAVLFHAGVYFSMDILFSANLLAYGVFVEWDRALKVGAVSRLLARREQAVKILRVWTWPILGLGCILAYTTVESPVSALRVLIGHGVRIRDSMLVLAASSIAVGYLAVVAVGGRKRRVVDCVHLHTDKHK